MGFDDDASHLTAEQDLSGRGIAGAQTLRKGLDVLIRVSKGDSTLREIATALGVNKTTVHRLASTLVEMEFLSYASRDGYSLGTRLLELGFAASQQITLTRIAHPHLARLSADTGDTVNLGVLEGEEVHYLDKMPGSRRIQVRCIVGERQALRHTGLGKALLFDADEDALREVFRREALRFPNYRYDLKTWLNLMNKYRSDGCALDLDENEDHVRCVAAPIRSIDGKIVAAVSVSSALQYVDDDRIKVLRNYVRDTAAAISYELGFKDK